MIEINSFSIKDKRGKRLLDDLNLKLNSEELTIIAGRPGSGKTLLLKAIKGIVSEGLSREGDIKKEGRTGLIFQEPRKQMVRKNVKMEAAFDLENQGFPREKMKSRINRYAEFLDAEYLLQRDMDEMSHGELTKTALLSTLVTEPDILLLDEPLSALDHPNRKMLVEIIRRLKEHDTTVVIAEHDVRELVRIADRIVMLKEGNVLEDGEPEEMKQVLHQEGVKIPYEWEIELMKDGGYDEDKS